MLCNYYDIKRSVKDKDNNGKTRTRIRTYYNTTKLNEKLKSSHVLGVGNQVEICDFEGSFYVYQNNLVPGEAGALATKKVTVNSRAKLLANLTKPKGQ